ncbi:hypothetical protein C2G38_2288881 [Gigaspora rosea]|uniref:Uncharacterized protein n=1 Tax=Gigaspora rosea TaxID=44941 RepID=A0A397U2Y6_9GLOM|nr:hypothetical protein C2G38_2288881 [Gigaspora rosea]
MNQENNILNLKRKSENKSKINKKTKLYNLQEIFEKEIKVGRYFHGLFEEYYKIVKILKMNHENNYAKVLVDDESKHEIIKFKSKPEDTKKIKYDFLNGFWGDDKKYKKYYVKRIRFLTEKEIVYYGWTINDIEHEGGCFGGEQTWHNRIFSDDKTDAYSKDEINQKFEFYN